VTSLLTVYVIGVGPDGSSVVPHQTSVAADVQVADPVVLAAADR